MKLAYSITYSVPDEQSNARREHSTWIRGKSGQKLTSKGIERILTKTVKGAVVVRVEQWVDGK